MKTVTLFEYSAPERPEDRDRLKKLENRLRRINKVTKATIFEPSWGTVKARNYVGIITVGKTTIQILPKLYRKDWEDEDQKSYDKKVEEATRNLLFMLSFTKRLKLKEAGLSRLKKERSDLYESIVYLFAKNLLETLKRNYRRDYERRTEDLRFVKGKVVLSRQIRKPVHDRIHCSYFELSEDNMINRILKYTCHLLSSRVKSRENWLLLQNILSIFDGVTLVPVRILDFEKIRFNRLNEDYEPFINLSRLFLENMSLELQSSQFRTFSLLFDMNVLFEEFIGEFLRKHRGDILGDTEFSNCQIHLQTKRRWLIERPKHSFRLIPDIIFTEDGKNIKLIIDTKYKILDSCKPYFGVSQDDIYQVFAYSKKFKCSKIVLLYPWDERIGDHSKGTGLLNSDHLPYKFDDQTKLYIATVDLKSGDLRDKNNLEKLRKNLNKLFCKISEL